MRALIIAVLLYASWIFALPRAAGVHCCSATEPSLSIRPVLPLKRIWRSQAEAFLRHMAV